MRWQKCLHALSDGGQLMRRAIFRILLCAALLPALLVGYAKRSDGYAYGGCRWPGNAPIAHYNTYTSSVSNYYLSTFVTGRGWWNNSIIDLTWSYSPSNYNVIVDQYSNVLDTNYAGTSFICTPGTTNIAQSPMPWMIVNTYLANNLSPDGAALMWAHELGHLDGLAHVTYVSCSDFTFTPRNVMVTTAAANFAWVYLSCGHALAPYPDDRIGVNARYPGGF